VSGRGTVFTYTVNYHPFNPAVPPPYVIAIVELVEQVGLRFTTNIVDCAVDEVSIGMAVEVTFEQAGDAWVPVFRPAPEDPTVGLQADGGESGAVTTNGGVSRSTGHEAGRGSVHRSGSA
jgi:hypothetical protein